MNRSPVGIFGKVSTTRLGDILRSMKITRLIFIIAAVIVAAWLLSLIFKLAAWVISGLVSVAAIIVIIGLVAGFVESRKTPK